jgi:hypothetical protein
MESQDSPTTFRVTNDYYSYLVGGKYLFDRSQSPSSVSDDPVNSYRNNSYGYRSDEFSVGTGLVVAGCSFTYGVGVPEDGAWPSMVSKSLGETASVVADPGASITGIVDKLFMYFRSFGNPKTLLCLFPDRYRLSVPIDGSTLVYDQSKPVFGSNGSSPRQGVFNVEFNPGGQSIKYMKKPYDADVVITEDIALYQSIRSIRLLEQYCRAANIKLLWSTWNLELAAIMSLISKREDLKFDNYFNLDVYVYRKSTQEHREAIFKTLNDLNSCVHEHEETDCTCYLVCHQDLLELHGEEQFNIGMDHHGVGRESAHYGVHFQAHVADAFLSRLALD